ncbi:starch binding domain-containing protein [Mycena polygramma]|nr:starch binding domain-containing protein [Mycena polygramma]
MPAANILSRLTSKPYISQEVIWGSGEPIQPSEYVGNDAFSGSGISILQNLDNKGWVAGTSANVFVANHDTERNGGSLDINSPSNTYITSTIFSLAHPCSATGGANGWLCQHRFVAFSGVVGFRNKVGSAAITNWVSPQSQQIAFGRGMRRSLRSAGFVAINNADSAWSATFTTSLPNVAYCDVISGKSSGGACTGSGPARSAIAIHTAALGSGGSSGGGGSTTVANIFLVGSISQLGSWDPTAFLALSSASYPVWTITVNLPPNTSFTYKFIRKETDGSVVWESDPDRSATTNGSGSQTITTSWR